MEPALEAIIYILVSQFSAVQGEDTAEETPAYQLQKEASVYSETNCKEAVSCPGRLALPKEAAICISAAIANKILFLRDNHCRIWSLKNNGSLRVLAQNMLFQVTNLNITVSDMRSNSSNRNSDVNNNPARLASS